ncbi:MAG: hypothetical protein WBZ36_21145 [Candidatus Nitrosopolaris sp.]
MSGIDPQQFKEAQRKSWDSVAPAWQEWWKTFENGAQVVSDRLVELVKINPDSRFRYCNRYWGTSYYCSNKNS